MDAPETATMADKLTVFLQRQMPQAQDIRVEGLRRIAGGISTENWLFDALWTETGRQTTQPLVLRRASAHEIVETTREDEFLVLQAIAGQGVPAPRAFWMEPRGGCFERLAMVLERRPGRTERTLLKEGNTLGLDQAMRVHIAQQMTDALIAIHRIDVERVPHLRADARAPALRELAQLEAAIERDGLGHEPELVLAACWLHSHLPAAPARETIVHGDYRPANVLVEQGQLSAVLDWELAHRGDPAEDLGWYLSSWYRHEHFIEGAWSPEQFIARYEQGTGTWVDRAAVRFWGVFAIYKLAIMAFHSVRALARGDQARLAPPPHRLIAALMRDLGEQNEGGQ
jgi:aminoglycoside phosphotransferase (APT) family kinase protein